MVAMEMRMEVLKMAVYCKSENRCIYDNDFEGIVMGKLGQMYGGNDNRSLEWTYHRSWKMF
ncbi:unnamed protein product [Camellia sinensis]